MGAVSLPLLTEAFKCVRVFLSQQVVALLQPGHLVAREGNTIQRVDEECAKAGSFGAKVTRLGRRRQGFHDCRGNTLQGGGGRAPAFRRADVLAGSARPSRHLCRFTEIALERPSARSQKLKLGVRP